MRARRPRPRRRRSGRCRGPYLSEASLLYSHRSRASTIAARASSWNSSAARLVVARETRPVAAAAHLIQIVGPRAVARPRPARPAALVSAPRRSRRRPRPLEPLEHLVEALQASARTPGVRPRFLDKGLAAVRIQELVGAHRQAAAAVQRGSLPEDGYLSAVVCCAVCLWRGRSAPLCGVPLR